MKKKDLEKFKELLEDEKKKIVRHLEDLTTSAEEEMGVTTASSDQLDVASSEINSANIHKIGKREAYLLKKIELALDKIAQGSYGECESCGEEIGVARLMARPVAQLCIDCKTEQENEERRYSSREEEEDSFDEASSDDDEES